METPDRQGNEDDGGVSFARKMVRVAVPIFLLMAAFQSVFGRWVSAAFHVATALLFGVRGGIDNWSKPARYLFIVVYVALAVGMFVELIFQAKALR
jgi:hypothetical protein